MFTEAERETDTEKTTTTSSKKVDPNIKNELERMTVWEDAIQKASKRFDVAPEEIRALIGTESAAMPNRRADDGAKKKSSGGARGLMQVVKSTWDQVKNTYSELAQYDFESNWNKPAVNIMFGTATLALKRKALKRFGLTGASSEKMAVIAYNTGEGVVKDAYNHAKEAGSERPDVDFMKFEHLAYAIKKHKAYTYWMPGNGGAKSNKSGTVDEAVKLKIEREVMGYAGKVEKRMNAQGKSLDADGTTETKTKTETKPEKKTETKTETTTETKTDTKTETEKSKTEGVTVTVGEMTPILPGHIITDSVGRNGKNRPGDVLAVQQQLNRHGVSAGTEDALIGTITIGAIETFQKKFLKKPDGLVELGKETERKLMEGMTQQTEEKKTETQQTETQKTETKKTETKPTKTDKQTEKQDKQKTETKTDTKVAKSPTYEQIKKNFYQTISGSSLTWHQALWCDRWKRHANPADCTGLPFDTIAANIQRQAVALQGVVNYFGKSLSVSSWFRPPAYNATTTNAAKKSVHMQGLATDFMVPGMSAASVRKVLQANPNIYPGKGELGTTGWVHLDLVHTKWFNP